MTIYLYWLIRNEAPYYVGVTRNKEQRYSGDRKNEMIIIETYENRIDARSAEEYWINQLRCWGFSVTNKDNKPKAIVYKQKGLVEKRYKITQEQREMINKLEIDLNIDPSEIVRMAINNFLEMAKTCHKAVQSNRATR